MQESKKHATIMAGLYFLQDAIKVPSRILEGDYEMVQVVAGYEKETNAPMYNYYLREPRTLFFVSADPSTFAIAALDKMCRVKQVKIFNQLAKIFAFMTLLTERNNNWPFTEGTDRVTMPMSDIKKILEIESSRAGLNDYEGVLGEAFKAVDIAKDIYDTTDNALLHSDIAADIESRESLKKAIGMVKHPGERRALKLSLLSFPKQEKSDV